MAARPPPRPPTTRPASPPMPAQRAYPPPPPPPTVGFHMSATELLHLTASVAALTVAFAFAFSHFNRPFAELFALPTSAEVNRAVATLDEAFLVVVLGFLLHEMAHKVVAQRLALWAEFRASGTGLVGALVMCIFTPIIFAAPGAVLIVGNASRKDGALISIAGPATNLVIGFAMLPFVGADPNPAEVGSVGNFFQLAALVNALLAVFNLVPVPPLDGSKIVRWNVGVYAVLLGLALLLLVTTFGPLY